MKLINFFARGTQPPPIVFQIANPEPLFHGVDNDPTAGMTTHSTDEFAEDGEQDLGTEPLQFLRLTPPEPGEALRVGPSVRWCRLPMPLALDHINVWLVDHADGCVVVDTGLNTSSCRDAWLALERDVLASTPVKGVLVTHMHPDHLGLAHWLAARHGVPVWMSRRTEDQAKRLFAEDDAARGEGERFLSAHGVTDPSLRPQLAPRAFASMLSGLPDVARHIADGEPLSFGDQRWTALEVYGHAEGHLCLHHAEHELLISGDQVLPTISPNISLTWRSRDMNPLGSFLASLSRLSQLSPSTLVLPSHGLPFVGLQARARDLQQHHTRQLDAITHACAEPRSAGELLPVLFRRPLAGMHVMLALAETVAHLEYLVHLGRLTRTPHGELVRYRAC